MISPNTDRWKIYFGNPSITRAGHVLGELKVDFVNRIFKYLHIYILYIEYLHTYEDENAFIVNYNFICF